MLRVITWFRRGEHTSGAAYFALVLAIMLPLFKPGYLLALDLLWTPKIPILSITSNFYLISVILHFLSYVVPSQLIEKLLLFGILWLAGYGTHKLVRSWGPTDAWPAYFGGILYVVNPFVYSRFLEGQFLVLLTMAMMPWFVVSLWKFLGCPNRQSSAWLIFWALALGISSLQAVYFMALAVVVSAVGMFVTRMVDTRAAFKWGIIAVCSWVVLSSYWLLPILIGTSSTDTLMGQFNRQFVESFQTAGDPKFGVVFNAAAMYGFWVDKLGRYVLPKNLVGIWPEIAVLIILLSGIGLISARRRVFAWILFVIGLIALVFGVGTAFAPFAGIFFWCFYHVPFFKGFREPEKFIGLLVLTYSFLGACGAKVVADNSKRFFAKHNELVGDFVLPLLILGLPFFYTPTELWGFSGQIKPTNYPSDWYVVNKQLNADHSNFKVLFLPWHQYLSFSFSPGVIGNPATNFFDKPTIEGNNLELGRIYTQVNTPTSLYIEQQILTLGPSVTDIGKRLDHLNIKYVILAKNFDVNQYLWLGKQNDVSLLSDSKNLLVYKNKAWKPGKPSSH